MLCRIYKKNNTHRPLDHDKDDSMDDMLGPVPPSMSIGSQHNAKFQFPKKGISFGTLLENQEHSLFEGMMGSDGINNGSMSQLGCSSSKPDLSLVNPLKRTLPSLYWTDEDTAGPSTSKRFHGDSNDGSMEKTDGSGSFATLLSQLPQTPPLQQQTMLGSMEDEIFRPPYQIPGLNWYS